jgi:O-acetyl-ADP-ribose deacetylase (regulator of RNase III)
MTIGDTSIEVVHGSVTLQDVDAIVNAANTALRGGGGMDGRIHREAGPELLAELIQVAPHGARTGTAVVTKAYNLPQQYVIHTPGPVWHGGKSGESELLASCYTSCLTEADRLNLESTAFCSISTGVYGYPLERAAPIAVSAVAAYLQEHSKSFLRRVVFALYSESEYREYRSAVEASTS